MAVIIGTKKNDTLKGTAQSDNILGLGGNDTLLGLAGVDTLDGGKGNDKLYGGAGKDILRGGVGDDLLDGGKDVDKLAGGAGNDVLEGGKGGDKLDGGAGTDWASYEHSTTGLTASLLGNLPQFSVIVSGDALGDTYANIENLRGSNQADLLVGNDGSNTIEGLKGDDFLAGAGGNDILIGGEGNDFLEGDAGADVLNGGAGTDWATYQNSSTGVTASLFGPIPSLGIFNTAEAAGDTYISVENLRGSNFADLLIGTNSGGIIEGLNGNDYLAGGAAIDTLIGGEGNDVLEGHAGGDILNGGNGTDTATYEFSGSGVNALLSPINGFANTGDALGDTYISIENLRGSQFGDILIGNSAANTIEGLGGNDSIAGGGGADILTGGAGADAFFYGFLTEGGDTITDFDTAADTIGVLKPTSIPNAGDFVPGHILGAINANELVHGNAADQAFAQFLIDANGDLSYDADGTGIVSTAVLVAHLSGINAATFLSSNIIVF